MIRLRGEQMAGGPGDVQPSRPDGRCPVLRHSQGVGAVDACRGLLTHRVVD